MSQIHDRHWLFKALHAPKPHKKHVTSINHFVWYLHHFNPLNVITTCIIAYPIPCCNAAVHYIIDAPQDYHQLCDSASTQEKLAFQGPDAMKSAFFIISFGPICYPSIFIMFVQDIDSHWKELATGKSIVINKDTNMHIIQ